jgi:hypothetical protein
MAGQNPGWEINYDLVFGFTGARLISNSGAPEGNYIANPGSIYINADNGDVYTKVTGSDENGWIKVANVNNIGTLIYGTDSSPQLLGVQKIQTGSIGLSGGVKAVTILPAVYNAGYAWGAIATSHTANPVHATVSTNTVTFTGTGTDTFDYIIFPIFVFG